MHTRGRLMKWAQDLRSQGTIHTHAGQTSMGCSCLLWWWNHPCTRGADCPPSREQWHLPEPSIRTRGRRFHSSFTPSFHGTIHTHAGQTLIPRLTGGMRWNHPYARGADHLHSILLDSHVEPSIRTRGRRLLTRYNVRMSTKLYSVACIMQ